MLTHLADISIRSLLLAVPAVIVLWILKRRRTAALQHAVWAAVVCGMLALFAFGQALPRLPLRILDRSAVSASANPPAAMIRNEAQEAAPQFPSPTPRTARRSIDWSGVAAYGYGVIAFAALAQFVTGMFLVRKLLATAHSIALAGANGVFESESIAVPFTVGWLRPRILLPLEWREWDREKLDAVLAHEGAHVRRRDGLVAVLAGVNRCVFWFHPLSWMLERKLALLAEQACDEACVAALGDRRRYAHLLLEMAGVVDGSQGRLRRHALTMAAGSHVRQRIDSLLQEGRTFSPGLTRAGWAAVMLCGIPFVWGAGAVELDRQPPLPRLEMPRWTAPAAPLPEQKLREPKPVLLAEAQAAPLQAAAPQSAPAVTPKFDGASIHPCKAGDGAGQGGRGGAGGRGINRSPGRLHVNCMSVWELINFYIAQGTDPLINDSTMPSDTQRVRGGPAWVYSDFYTIDAETSDPAANGPASGSSPSSKLLMGPMLQSLLEDRFQLKTHREIEEVPMYALTVAESGLKLKPMEEGGCIPIVEGFMPRPPREKPACGWIGWGTSGPNRTLEGGGVPLSRVAEGLGDLFMDRHVLDRTGIATIFNIHLEYAPDRNTPAKIPGGLPVDSSSAIPPAPSIFTAIEQQLGLRLVPEKGPHGFIVIDRVERPSD